MRVLLATEGESDEIVAEALIRRIHADAAIEKKKFPARGFSVVRRLIDTLARAAYFGHYDLLVVHFDLDDTLSGDFHHVGESPRWATIKSEIEATVENLPSADREGPLATILMAPCQSTESWLIWGVEDENGEKWERFHRHKLKRRLFGDPPRGLMEKTRLIIDNLTIQMDGNSAWPRSLRSFVESLEESKR